MGYDYLGRSKLYAEITASVGKRESPTPYNTLAHRHFDRLGRDVKRARKAMAAYAEEGKIKHYVSKELGLNRYEFSDGSMLVFGHTGCYLVDVNCSMSLRDYYHRFGPYTVGEEVFFIELRRASRELFQNVVLPTIPAD